MSAAPATRETKNAYSCDTPRSRGLTGSRSTAPGFEAEGFVTTRTPGWPRAIPEHPRIYTRLVLASIAALAEATARVLSGVPVQRTSSLAREESTRFHYQRLRPSPTTAQP